MGRREETDNKRGSNEGAITDTFSLPESSAGFDEQPLHDLVVKTPVFARLPIVFHIETGKAERFSESEHSTERKKRKRQVHPGVFS